MRAILIDKDQDGHRVAVTDVDERDLPEGDVTVRIDYSTLNYKDALAASGHPGVAGPLPHVPGIDAAGVVADEELVWKELVEVIADQPFGDYLQQAIFEPLGMADTGFHVPDESAARFAASSSSSISETTFPRRT